LLAWSRPDRSSQPDCLADAGPSHTSARLGAAFGAFLLMNPIHRDVTQGQVQFAYFSPPVGGPKARTVETWAPSCRSTSRCMGFIRTNAAKSEPVSTVRPVDAVNSLSSRRPASCMRSRTQFIAAANSAAAGVPSAECGRITRVVKTQTLWYTSPCERIGQELAGELRRSCFMAFRREIYARFADRPQPRDDPRQLSTLAVSGMSNSGRASLNARVSNRVGAERLGKILLNVCVTHFQDDSARPPMRLTSTSSSSFRARPSSSDASAPCDRASTSADEPVQ
jgi:hypothetical protein